MLGVEGFRGLGVWELGLGGGGALGFRVVGDFWVWCLGFRVLRLGFRVWGTGLVALHSYIVS